MKLRNLLLALPLAAVSVAAVADPSMQYPVNQTFSIHVVTLYPHQALSGSVSEGKLIGDHQSFNTPTDDSQYAVMFDDPSGSGYGQVVFNLDVTKEGGNRKCTFILNRKPVMINGHKSQYYTVSAVIRGFTCHSTLNSTGAGFDLLAS